MPLASAAAGRAGARLASQDAAERSRGVTIEARYTVGEYDILILSAQQSRAGVVAAGERLPDSRWRFRRCSAVT